MDIPLNEIGYQKRKHLGMERIKTGFRHIIFEIPKKKNQVEMSSRQLAI